MVSRVDNDVATAQVGRSAAITASDREIQQVEPTQAVALQAERKPENEPYLQENQAESIVESMNKFLVSTDSQLKFVLHDKLNEYYVAIINSKTDEVIREIPSKKLLDIHAAMKEFVGLLVDRKI